MNRVKKGLMVQGVYEGAIPIPLPKTYCKDDLCIEHDEIVPVDSLKQWDYLRDVTKDFHKYGYDIPIAKTTSLLVKSCKKCI